jgi:hypothetical protein
VIVWGRKIWAGAALLTIAGCGDAPDHQKLTEAGAEPIACALEGAKTFDRTCTVSEMSGEGGTVLVVGRSDVGYRRLQITTDGRGLVSADGAEAAKVTIVGEGVIEVAVGSDRYRLPANTGGAR